MNVNSIDYKQRVQKVLKGVYGYGYEYALNKYLKLGFSIIPVAGPHAKKEEDFKKPLIKWTEFQKRKPTKEEVINWFTSYPKANIGIVAGQISNLVVVDLDDEEAQEWAKQQGLFDLGAPCVRTARGLHLYFKYPNPEKGLVQTVSGFQGKKIDIRANGGFVIAPPSVHQSGVQYTWLVEPNENIPELPDIFLQKEKEQLQTQKVNILEQIKERIKPHWQEGQRQELCIYITGTLLKAGFKEEEVTNLIIDIMQETGDTELKMRLAGIKETIKKHENKEPVKGITGLLELGVDIKDLLIKTKTKNTDIEKFRPTIPNVCELLIEYLPSKSKGAFLDYDNFFVKIFYNDQEFTQKDEDLIHNDLELITNRKIPTETLQKAIRVVAYQNERDRLKEYLENCEKNWDGETRIHCFFKNVFGVELDEYTTKIAKNFFVGAVARALQPGIFLKNILVLIGKQDSNKSRVIAALGSEFSKEINVSISSEKDFFMAIQGAWLCEIPEMEALRKADRNRIKAIISAVTDRFRPPYSRVVQDFPRRCIFVCTTNDQEIYDDPTGGTRFWPVHIQKAGDIEYVQKFRDQLWGEAVWEYRKGYEFWSVNSRLAKEKQDEVARTSVVEEILTEELANIKETTIAKVAEILGIIKIDEFGRLDTRALNKTKEMEIADALRKLGFQKKLIRKDGKVKKIWSRTP